MSTDEFMAQLELICSAYLSDDTHLQYQFSYIGHFANDILAACLRYKNNIVVHLEEKIIRTDKI